MKERKLIASVLVGNTMEFYDFIVFAFMSKYIATLFFPSADILASYIATFGVFACGYLMRPFGGLFFGYIGDKYGRKTSLSYSIVLITVTTALMGLVPTYESIGICAPILLTLCRLVQGFSVSGEEGGAAVYLAELVGKKRAAYAGSLVLGSAYFGVLLGSIVCLILALIFSLEQINAFAWRLPFIFSIALGVPSLIMRRNLVESAEFSKVEVKSNPVKSLFKEHSRSILFDIVMVASLSIPIYLFTIFIPSYLNASVGMDTLVSQIISVVSLVFLSLGVPMLGRIADKRGPHKVYALGCLYNIVLAYPAFLLIASGHYIAVAVGIIMFGIGLLFIAGPMFAILIFKYTADVRYTAVSFIFNTSMSIFGSVTPAIAFYLISKSGSITIPWVLVAISGMIGLIFSSKRLRERDYDIKTDSSTIASSS